MLVLIVTDGQENASREYSFEAVRALIEQKEEDGWNFAYMGANQDSYAVGGSLNIRADFTANYDATFGGTTMNYQRMASATSKYRASKAKGMSAPRFFDASVQQTGPRSWPHCPLGSQLAGTCPMRKPASPGGKESGLGCIWR